MRDRVFSGWWQVVVAMTVQMVGISIFTAYSVVAAPLQQAFQPSRMVLMLSVPVTILVSGILNPFLGAAMGRHSLRLLMLAGAACMAGGFLALSFTTSIVEVIIVYAVLMAPASILLGPPAAATLLSRWFSRRRGRALSVAGMGAAFSGLIFAPLTQLLVDAFEWRMALRLLAAIAFAVTVPVIALLAVDRPSDRNQHPDGDPGPLRGEAIAVAPIVSTATVIRNVNFWLIAMITGLVFAISTALLSNMVQLAADKGISAQQGAWLLAVFACANFCGKTLFASIGDYANPRLVFAMALIVVTLSLAVCLTAGSFLPLLAGVVLFGLPIGCLVPLWALLLSNLFGPESVGKVIGLGALFTMPLSLVAAPFFGGVFDRTGSYDHAFLICIVLVAASLPGLVKLRLGPSQAVPRAAPAAGTAG